MTTAHPYHPGARTALFGPMPTTAANIRSLDELAQINERGALPGVRPRLYYGRVMLDPTRVGRDAGLVSGEVIYPLARLTGSLVTVALDIVAEVPDGIPDRLVRMVTENGRKLRFTDQGFAQE